MPSTGLLDSYFLITCCLIKESAHLYILRLSKATDISYITIEDKWNKRMMMMIWNGYYDIIL